MRVDTRGGSGLTASASGYRVVRKWSRTYLREIIREDIPKSRSPGPEHLRSRLEIPAKDVRSLCPQGRSGLHSDRGPCHPAPGPANLRAGADRLHMHVSAEDDAGLAQVRHIVVTDLVTFAFRKAPESLGWHWPERRPSLHAPVPACPRPRMQKAAPPGPPSRPGHRRRARQNALKVSVVRVRSIPSIPLKHSSTNRPTSASSGG